MREQRCYFDGSVHAEDIPICAYAEPALYKRGIDNVNER